MRLSVAPSAVRIVTESKGGFPRRKGIPRGHVIASTVSLKWECVLLPKIGTEDAGLKITADSAVALRT